MTTVTSAPGARGRRTVLPRLAAFLGRLPRSVAFAGTLLLLLVVVALGSDLLRPINDAAVDPDGVLQAPSFAHPMGTDEGRARSPHEGHPRRARF